MIFSAIKRLKTIFEPDPLYLDLLELCRGLGHGALAGF